MPTIRAQVRIPMFTNQPQDIITNTLHFEETVPMTLQAAGDAINPLLEAFYDAIYSPQEMANYMLPNLATVRYYRLDQPEPRVPYEKVLPMGGFTTTASLLPTETSIVLSFQGIRLGGTPQARRRGRIYIGGLASGVMAASTTSAFPLFGSSIRANVAGAAGVLKDASLTATLPWSVWSTVDQVPVRIDNGWVDNSPDTQRRRGVSSTVRLAWS